MSAAPVETQAAPATPATPAADASGFPALKGVPAPGATPAAPATPEAAPTPKWFDGLSTDDKTYLAAKGWDKDGKGPEDILKSYRNIERLRGVDADKLVKLPDWSKPESVAEYRAAIGVPAEVTGYQADPAVVAEGLVDPAMAADFSLEMGLTQAQHDVFMRRASAMFRAATQEQAEERGRREAVALGELAKQWGTKAPEYNQAAANAITAVGVTDAELAALNASELGQAGTRALLARFGVKMGEHTRPAENGGGLNMPTVDSAKAELVALKSDQAFLAKLGAGDRESLAKLDQLQKIAYGV